jgi:putative holliday junction resolvase
MKQPDQPLDVIFANVADYAPLAGLDLGSKTIGIAISDINWMIATPVFTIERGKFTADAEALMDFVTKRKIGGLVIGLPLNMNGTEGPMVQSVRAFVRNLARFNPPPIGYWDERLSTAAVTRTLLEADASRRRRDQVVDKMAAAYILQGALDWLSRPPPISNEQSDV